MPPLRCTIRRHLAEVVTDHSDKTSTVVWRDPATCSIARDAANGESPTGRDIGSKRRVDLLGLLAHGSARVIRRAPRPRKHTKRGSFTLSGGVSVIDSNAEIDGAWEAASLSRTGPGIGDLFPVVPDSQGSVGCQGPTHVGNGLMLGLPLPLRARYATVPAHAERRMTLPSAVAPILPPSCAESVRERATAPAAHSSCIASLSRRCVGGRTRRRASLVGQWVRVLWQADRQWYCGQVRGYHASQQVREKRDRACVYVRALHEQCSRPVADRPL
jgi:hypothetical protein